MNRLLQNNPVKWAAALGLPLAVLLAEASAWWWMNPEQSDSVAVLSYRFPSEQPRTTISAPQPGVMDALRCDAASVGKIEFDGGRSIEVSFFEWDGTDRTGLMQAFGHSPDVCMAASGHKVQEFLPSRRFKLGEQEIVLDVTRYVGRNGEPFFIYKVPWTERAWGLNLLRDGPTGKEFREFKFKAVAKRWKPHFARVLMAGVSGCRDEQESWNLMQEHVLKDLEMKERLLDLP